MKKTIYLSLITALITTAAVIAASCGTTPEEAPPPPDTREPEVSPGLPPPGDSEEPTDLTVSWNPDGVLGDNEYIGEMQYEEYEIRWSYDRSNIYIGIRVKTEGWVAIGFNPTTAMQDADIVLGRVQNGQAEVSDQFSTGLFGPHQPDSELGGSDDILEFGGREEGGYTTIEFSRSLLTGDTYDNDLSPGTTIDIIWSYGSNDDIERQHTTRGHGEIAL